MKKPILAIPIGDPAGIGPEIVLKALCNQEVIEKANCLIVGSKKVLEKAMTYSLIHPIKLRVVDSFNPEYTKADEMQLVDIDNVNLSELKMGQVSSMCGKASYDYIKKCIQLAQAGVVDAIVTPPINKESLKAAGINYIGHTEIFGGLLGIDDPLTMFEVHGLRVFFLTRHVSLRKACDMVTKERIMDYIARCFQALQKLGVKDGVMAVAGLNPHSGEHGLFGDEERRFIIPAVKEMQSKGYAVEGPISADSVFYLALHGRYNSVLSLYHDQGHIATKTYDFERTVSITTGLPFLRISVDHGTAFDIAGKGVASEISMVEAILVAIKYALIYKNNYYNLHDNAAI